MNAGPEEIAAAVARLRAGGVVAFPTETVYGLGALALDAAAVARVFALKGRPSHNPLIVHVSDEAMARRVVSSWGREAGLLAGAFWPGPLTLVLPRAASVPDRVTAGSPNVAVRSPDHPITLALLVALDQPLVGPSANPSGRVSPTAAAHVRAAFSTEQVYLLDGGECSRGIESTVLTLAEPAPRILRPGVIGALEIARVIGREVVSPAPLRESPDAGAPVDSPGQLPSHYAPAAAAVLFERHELGTVLRTESRRVVVLSHEPLDIAPPHALEPMPAEPRAYAASLYAALRRADAREPDLIAVLRPEPVGPDAHIWEAVLDRLRRATALP